MPRAKRQKNRYCWRSNFSEPVFLAILNQWCKAKPAKRAHKTISRWARRHKHKRVKRRETITEHFRDLGVHLWTVGTSQALLERHWEQTGANPDSLEALSASVEELTATFKALQYFADRRAGKERPESPALYAGLDEESPFFGSLMRDFTNANGFSWKWTHAYYARARVLDELRSTGLSPKDTIAGLFLAMTELLEEHPLRKPLPPEKFYWSDYWHDGLKDDDYDAKWTIPSLTASRQNSEPRQSERSYDDSDVSAQKKTKQKNRLYGRTSKSEETFLAVLNQWCKRRTAAEAERTISRWANRYGYSPLRREAITKLYSELGTRLWTCWTSQILLTEYAKSNNTSPESAEALDEVVKGLLVTHEGLTEMYDSMRTKDGREDYALLEATSAGAMLMSDFRRANGFSVKWMHAYFSRASFLGSDMDEGKSLKEAIQHLNSAMRSHLQKFPLRKPLPPDEFHWSDYWLDGLQGLDRDFSVSRNP